MPKKADVLKQWDFVSDRLSTQVRTIAFGVLVFAWGVLVSESTVIEDLAQRFGRQLIAVVVLTVLVMLCDFLQYVAGYWNVSKLVSEMASSKAEEGQYDQNSLSFKLRVLLFWTKIALMSATVILLVCVLGYWLFTKPSTASI